MNEQEGRNLADKLRTEMRRIQRSSRKKNKSKNLGIADLMKPVLRQAEGILEEAIESEIRRRKNGKGPGIGMWFRGRVKSRQPQS